jgi:hypothetical protein
MDLYNKILSIYPELTIDDFSPFKRIIVLQDDSDGKGNYIKEWNHPTLTQPTAEQLNQG